MIILPETCMHFKCKNNTHWCSLSSTDFCRTLLKVTTSCLLVWNPCNLCGQLHMKLTIWIIDEEASPGRSPSVSLERNGLCTISGVAPRSYFYSIHKEYSAVFSLPMGAQQQDHLCKHSQNSIHNHMLHTSGFYTSDVDLYSITLVHLFFSKYEVTHFSRSNQVNQIDFVESCPQGHVLKEIQSKHPNPKIQTKVLLDTVPDL